MKSNKFDAFMELVQKEAQEKRIPDFLLAVARGMTL